MKTLSIVCFLAYLKLVPCASSQNFWQASKLNGIGGISSLATDYSGLVFVGYSSSGVWRSTDDGISWDPVNTNLSDLSINSLVVTPTGALLAATRTAGVWRSSDNGASWNPSGLSARINTFTTARGVVYAGDGFWCSGIYGSTDDGLTWKPLNSGLSTCINGIAGAVVPNTQRSIDGTLVYLFAATGTAGVYRSIDNATNWGVSGKNVSTPGTVPAIVNEKTGHIFVGTSNNPTIPSVGKGLFRSTDVGDSWTQLADLPINQLATLAVNSKGTIFAGSLLRDGVYMSQDDGTHWTQTNGGITNITTSIGALSINSSGYAFAATGADLYRSIASTTSTSAQLKVPFISQCDVKWCNDDYPGGGTVFSYGCHLTCEVMLINFYARQQRVNFATTPPVLNKWLKNNNGYTEGLGPKPRKVAEFARTIGHIQLWHDGTDYASRSALTDGALNGYLANNNPVILQVCGPTGSGQHYVVATGQLNSGSVSTYYINDPTYSRIRQSRLDEGSYRDTYRSMEKYTQTNKGSTELTIGGGSPIELLVIDPAGRRTGFDQGTGQLLNEIPGSFYGVESLAADDSSGLSTPEKVFLDIWTPKEGKYKMIIQGTGTGTFQLNVSGYDTSGQLTTQSLSGSVTTGSRQIDSMVYSPTAGILLNVHSGVTRVPNDFSLEDNYPNPFNPSTTIQYALPRRAQVTLAVFNTLGQQVATLQNGELDAGYHEVRFDGTHLPSGVYFYRMQAGGYTETKKLLLVR
jgi:hypothetical protein